MALEQLAVVIRQLQRELEKEQIGWKNQASSCGLVQRPVPTTASMIHIDRTEDTSVS